MQIPEAYYEEDASPDPNVRAMEASDVYAPCTRAELSALNWFTQRGCPVNPRLLCLLKAVQDGDDTPVPGGWVVFIIMERVPGVPLTDFPAYDYAKREKIRQTFLNGLREITSHHVTLFYYNPSNLIYDGEQDNCYFIDYESVSIDPIKPTPPIILEDDYFIKSEYRLWGLDDEALVLMKPAHLAASENEKLCGDVLRTGEVEKGATLLTV